MKADVVVAFEEVPREEVFRYGIAQPKSEVNDVFELESLIEKPSVHEAPSNLAVAARYVFSPVIFEKLAETRPGKGGEIQLTDGIRLLLKRRQIYGLLFTGKRYDAGDKLGYLKATVELALRNPTLSEPFREYLRGLAGTL